MTPPKFIRDQIANDDIDGAKPVKKRHYETRDILSVSDIDGAKTKGVYQRTRTQYDGFNYHDVTKKQFAT